MAGALAERAFVDKLQAAGLVEVEIQERRPWSVDDCARYPLFTGELVALMRRLIDPARQDNVATRVIATARKPDQERLPQA